MRVVSVGRGLLLLLVVSLCINAYADEQIYEVVGIGECGDCKENNFKTSDAFSGLHVTIDCKSKSGEIKRIGDGEVDEFGKFKIYLPQEIIQNGKSLKEECYAQLHSAAAIPCPTHNGLEASKIIFKSQTNNKYTFSLTKTLKFSSALCTSKFLWPYFKYPPLPKTHYWKKSWPKISFPPLKKWPPLYKSKPLPPPIPIYKPPVVKSVPIYKPKPPVVKPLPPPTPVYKPKPPVVKPLPPPTPVYKPKPPVYKPKPPVYKPKPPVYKPKPPVYKPKPPVVKPLPPPTPVYKPKPPVYKPKPPVYKPKPPVYEPPKKPLPPTTPVYKPKPKSPVVKPLPPPIPVYKPPVVTKPLPPPFPQYPIPPFFKKPCPPFSKIPPKYVKHPKFGYFPPLPPFFPHP